MPGSERQPLPLAYLEMDADPADCRTRGSDHAPEGGTGRRAKCATLCQAMPSGWCALGNVHELMCFNRLAFDDPAAGWGGMVERVPLVVLFFIAFNLLERRPAGSLMGWPWSTSRAYT